MLFRSIPAYDVPHSNGLLPGRSFLPADKDYRLMYISLIAAATQLSSVGLSLSLLRLKQALLLSYSKLYYDLFCQTCPSYVREMLGRC